MIPQHNSQLSTKHGQFSSKLPLCIGVLLRQDDIKGYADGVTALIITDNSSCPFFKLCHSETSLITLIEIKSFNEMGEHAIGRLLPSSTG